MLQTVALRCVARFHFAKPPIKEVCHEAIRRYLVTRHFRRHLGFRLHTGVGHQNGRQMLHVVRWWALLQVQDGYAAGCGAPHLQRLCSLMPSRRAHARRQVPDVPGRESAMHADRRSRRSLQRPSIRRTAKDVAAQSLAIDPGRRARLHIPGVSMWIFTGHELEFLFGLNTSWNRLYSHELARLLKQDDGVTPNGTVGLPRIALGYGELNRAILASLV